MDLGLNTLTDDQIVDLLDQVLTELVGREHYVRTAAQQTILTQSQKLKALKGCLKDAVLLASAEFEEQLKADVCKWVEDEVAAGQIKLFTAKEEADMVAQADAAHRDFLRREALVEQARKDAAEAAAWRQANLRQAIPPTANWRNTSGLGSSGPTAPSGQTPGAYPSAYGDPKK